MIHEDIQSQSAFVREKAFRASDLVRGWLIGGMVAVGLIASSGLQAMFLQAMHGV